MPDQSGIQYRLVDEYEEVYELPFTTSAEPLTFSEITSMLNELIHQDSLWLECQYRVDLDSDDDLDWISMKSDFYLELSDWNEWNFEQARDRIK